MEIADLRRLFQYDRWANRQVAQVLTNSAAAPPKCVRWMAHIVGAEAQWLARLKEKPAPMPVWPEFSVADALAQLEVVGRAWQDFLDGLDDSALRSKCQYANTKGERYASSVGDILMHVVMHSAYHRGQIAADMRANGLEPVYTDFIHAARQGYVADLPKA
jgi:uncharacterized damage-inducible protein DinB